MKIKKLSAAEKRRRIVPASVERDARADAIMRATGRVKVAATIKPK